MVRTAEQEVSKNFSTGEVNSIMVKYIIALSRSKHSNAEAPRRFVIVCLKQSATLTILPYSIGNTVNVSNWTLLDYSDTLDYKMLENVKRADGIF